MTPPHGSPPGTTWFLRDQAELDTLVAALTRDLSPGRRVRLWSAGCSTGQEPYGLAMALLDAGLQPQILATDLRPLALAEASAGRYSARAAAPLPPAWRARYTVAEKAGAVRMHPSLSARLRFEQHDIESGAEPPSGSGPFDAIVCRNVLIYIERPAAVAIVARLATYLRPGGYLLLSAAERPLAWLSGLLCEDPDFKDSVLLRRAPAVGDSDAGLPAVTTGSSKPPAAAQRPPAGRPSTVSDRSLGRGSSRLSDPAIPLLSGRESRRDSGPNSALHSGREIDLATVSSLLQRGEFAAALPLLDALAAREDTQAVAYLLRGLALKHTGRLSESAVALRGACYLSASDAWMAPYQLGLVLEQLGLPVEAVEAYRHALSVLRAGGRSGLPAGWPVEEALPATITEACLARLQALSRRGPF